MADEPKAVEPKRNLADVGGTPGGIGEFLLGLALLIGGGYLFLDNVQVSSAGGWGQWGVGGVSTFGLTLIPIFIGICLLFFNSKSKAGWVLTGGGIIIIFVGVLARMHIWFQRQSLFHTLLMLALMGAGIGLIARSMRSHPARTPS